MPMFRWAAAAGVAAAVMGAALVHAQSTLPPRLRGPALEGPNIAQLERGQRAYVTGNCHYCHGATLSDARGGGADLGTSMLVQMDRDGDMMGPVLRAGLPRTQTAMPAYRTMTDAELKDLSAYVHFLRRLLHEKAALAAPLEPADAGAGAVLFYESCAGCHAGAKELAPAVAANDAAALRAKIVRPPFTERANTDLAAREAHWRLTEALSPADGANLTAYLKRSGGRMTVAYARAMKPPRREISAVFEQQCAICHGPGGAGSDRAKALVNNDLVASLGPAGIKQIISGGLPSGMPAFKMSPEELDAFAGLLISRNPPS